MACLHSPEIPYLDCEVRAFRLCVFGVERGGGEGRVDTLLFQRACHGAKDRDES